MDRTQLQALFQTLTGLDDQEVLAKSSILELAATQVERRVKSGIDLDEQQDILLMLAAVMAQYFDTLAGATGATSVKVADITIAEEGDLQLTQLKRLKDEIMALAAPLLLDDEFVFVLA